MADPPNPPPVILAPIAPFARAVSTARSSSGVEIWKSLLIDRCEASRNLPMSLATLFAERAHGVQHPLVLGDHVTHPTERLPDQYRARPRRSLDATSRSDPTSSSFAPSSQDARPLRVPVGRVLVRLARCR